MIQRGKEIQNSQFAQFFQRAESFEFSQKDFTRAGELYKECTLLAPTKQYRAIAFEGLGRCLLSARKYDEAEKIYYELSKNYGQFQNNAGHPFGIIAAFQLFEIARERKENEVCLGILLKLYKEIKVGNWLINQSVYDFYIAEIESILNSEEGKYPDVQESYSDIQKQPSPYKQALIIADFLKRNIIPEINRCHNSVPGPILSSRVSRGKLHSGRAEPSWNFPG